MIFNILYLAVLAWFFCTSYTIAMQEKESKNNKKIYNTALIQLIDHSSAKGAGRYFDKIYNKIINSTEDLLKNNSDSNLSTIKLKSAVQEMKSLHQDFQQQKGKAAFESYFCRTEPALFEALRNVIWQVHCKYNIEDFRKKYKMCLPLIIGKSALIDCQMRLSGKIENNKKYEKTVKQWIENNKVLEDDNNMKGVSSALIRAGDCILELSKNRAKCSLEKLKKLQHITRVLKENENKPPFLSMLVVKNIPPLLHLIPDLSLDILKSKVKLECLERCTLLRGVADIVIYHFNMYQIALKETNKV